ncbi:MAG: cytochrome c3 family protein [Spirochaetota bacterium]
MKKKLGILFIVFIISIPLLLLAQGKVQVKKSRSDPINGQVTFDHNIHKKNGVAKCVTCHHVDKPGRSCADAECHFDKKNGGFNAIHETCLGCHRTKKGKAPITCTQCHK